MSALENQQAISWFTGILEGEGDCDGYDGYRITISNSDMDIINECTKILRRNYILHSVLLRKLVENRKQVYSIRIGRKDDCYNLLRLLNNKFQCRFQEFSEKLSAPQTTRATTLISDLHWLVGIFEAEGTLTINKDRLDRLVPNININNTNIKIMEKVTITLKNLDISWFISDSFSKLSTKRRHDIVIQGIKKCLKFLTNTRFLWISEKYNLKAELIYDFCKEAREDIKSYSERKYSEKQHQAYRIIRQMI